MASVSHDMVELHFVIGHVGYRSIECSQTCGGSREGAGELAGVVAMRYGFEKASMGRTRCARGYGMWGVTEACAVELMRARSGRVFGG
jgi:hypothetical protein